MRSDSAHDEVPLASLVDADRGISYGIVQPGQHDPDGVPIVRVTDIRGGRVSPDDPLRVHPEIAAKYGRTKLRGGELLLTLVGTVGETAIVPPSLAGWNTARAVAVLPVRSDPGPLWVQYCLRTGQAREHVGNRQNTTVQATLNLRDVAALPIPMPPRHIRHAIVAVLRALDDKIELNRKMNRTLEEMAQTCIFECYRDADPTESRPANGWILRLLGEICATAGGDIQTGPFGTQLHAADYVPIGVPSVMPKDLKDDRISEEGVARIREEDARRLMMYRLEEGDIVVSRRGDVERRALVTQRERGWLCGTGCLRIRAGGTHEDCIFLYYYLGHPTVRAWIVRHAQGATMPNLNTRILGSLPVLLPPPAIRARVCSLLEPMHMRREANFDESATLAQLRDTLLPKLISGEIRVPEAERTVEAAV